MSVVEIHWVSHQWLAHLFSRNRWVELRAIGDGVRRDWFSSPDRLWSQARKWSGPGVQLFTSLNKVDEVPDGGIAADNVSLITHLLFDFDPIRPKGINATDAELAEAVAARDFFVDNMTGHGLPEPFRAVSGNGAHAVYPVGFHATSDNEQTLGVMYRDLSRVYSTPTVKLDTCTYNRSRLTRLYGTFNRKAPASEGRPQRLSSIDPPATVEISSDEWNRVRKIYRPAETPAVERDDRKYKPSGRGDYTTLDIVAWFEARGLYVGHIYGNRHEVICPWEHEHSDSTPRDTIIFEAQGKGDWAGFFCHHEHCKGRRILDVLDYLGGADAFCSRKWRA